MKKIILIATLLLVMLSGCAKQGTNTLVIGVDDTFAPMGFRDENNALVGFDIDLANLVADKMGVEFEFKTIDWALKEEELNNKKIDLIWNGYSITNKRQEMVNFTDSYLENRQVVVVLGESKIEDKEELKDKRIAVQKESSSLDIVLAAGISEDNIVELNTNIDCFIELEEGNVDAIVCDEVLARYVIIQRSIERNPDYFKVLADDFGVEEYAVGVRKDDTKLLDDLNKALDTIKADGSFDKLVTKWFAE